MATGHTFPPYVPTGDPEAWDAPLTPAEVDLATDIFKTLRYLAQAIRYDDIKPGDEPKSRYVLRFDFDETQPPEARVHIIYDCHEWSSGYREDGVGPDLGTALTRLSDEDGNNGTNLLREE